MATARLEQDALSTLLSVDDHLSSHDDDAPSPRVANAAVGMHSKLRPWAARTAEANATAKIRASNLTQMNKQPEIALVELAMVGPGKRGKQGDKKPRAVSRNTDVAHAPLPPPMRVVVAAERAGEASDDSQLESSDQENDRRFSRELAEPSDGCSAAGGGSGLVARGGMTFDKLHKVRKDASASSSPGRAGDKMVFGTAAAGVTLPAMIKTVTRNGLHAACDDSDDDGMKSLKHMMQRAEIGILPPAARLSAESPLDALGASGLGVKVLPMTTHSLQVGQAANPVFVKERLAQSVFDHIPVGVGSQGIIPTSSKNLEEALEMGMDWSLREGYSWAEDKEHCEEQGRMLQADPSKVSSRAKKRGLPQLGTLGAGNHYAEIQVVDEIFDAFSAKQMGIDTPGQVCVMIHSGSRGLGHQVATDALTAMEAAMARDSIHVNDRQLACARIDSAEGRDYLSGMAAAANYAWVNRSSMTFLVRQAFSKVFGQTPDDLDMNVVYDVSHNIAKVEEHLVGGSVKKLLVHRKGATRAFPPHHPLIPVDYQFTGQPVLVGGTMGTCSYVLTGTDKGMAETFGSTCHGAGRALSRNKSRNALEYTEVLQSLADRGISIRVASPKLVMEESPESYKDVTAVVDTCHAAGISNKTVKLRPIAVIKG